MGSAEGRRGEHRGGAALALVDRSDEEGRLSE